MPCTTCGLPCPPLDREEPIRRPCPRCEVPLAAVDLGHGTWIHGCMSCRWTFLPPRAWSRVFDEPALAPVIAARVPMPTIRIEDVLPLASCPACGHEMDRARFAATSKVVIDTCRWQHGVWLDAGDIDKLVAHAAEMDRMPIAPVAEPPPQVPVEIPHVPSSIAPRPQGGINFVSALFILLGALVAIYMGIQLIGPSCRDGASTEIHM